MTKGFNLQRPAAGYCVAKELNLQGSHYYVCSTDETFLPRFSRNYKASTSNSVEYLKEMVHWYVFQLDRRQYRRNVEVVAIPRL